MLVIACLYTIIEKKTLLVIFSQAVVRFYASVLLMLSVVVAANAENSLGSESASYEE